MSQDDETMSDRELARMLSELPAPEPSAALRRAVAEIPLRHPHASSGFVWPLRSLWRATLSAALVALLGMAAGFATAEPPPVDEEWEDMRALAFVNEAELSPELQGLEP